MLTATGDNLDNMSPFSRREWIEIIQDSDLMLLIIVSLLTKGVD